MTQRDQAPATALVVRKAGKLWGRRISERGRGPLREARSARPGEIWTCEVDESGAPRDLIDRIGPERDARAVIEALALASGELPHSPQIEAAAAAARDRSPSLRRDLRSLCVFTIDGASSKDFDDAISARREGDQIRVWVHVADVSAYVRAGDELDREARRRATSVYLPGRVIPMLPERLSNGVCSLVPGEDRAAVTVEMLLDRGQVVSREIYRSVICSDARLTYAGVDEIFLGRSEPGPTYAAALAAARQAAIDRAREEDEHEIMRDGEPVYQISEQGEVVGVTRREPSESQTLIERLMILANTTVARELTARRTPALWRTHTEDPERAQRVLGRLRSLGIHPDSASSQDLRAAVSGRSHPLQALTLGALQAAEYSPELSPHQGLGIDCYTHFTSPIRRYADLVVHRAILVELGLDDLDQAPRFVDLPGLGEWLTERTLIAKRLDRAAQKVCSAALIDRRVRRGELRPVLWGKVSGISGRAGVFCRIPAAEGCLGARALGGEPNEWETTWRTESGRELRIGDRVRVKIGRVDLAAGRIELDLA